KFIGCRERFSVALRDDMELAEQKTRDNTGMQLLIAVDYGGHWDIVNRARAMARDCLMGKLSCDAINEQTFRSGMSLGDVPSPDLFIRTGGERRISNFLLWDLAYSELFFSDTLWPDF